MSDIFNKNTKANDEHIARYLAMVDERLKKLHEWIIRQVPPKENGKIDAIAGITTTLFINER